MSTVLVVVIGAIAMFLSDIISTIMVQAEAANKGYLAAFMDTIGWLVSIAVTYISLDALNGSDFLRKVLVIISVSVANYFGTLVGVGIGAKIMRRKPIQAGPLSNALIKKISKSNGLEP